MWKALLLVSALAGTAFAALAQPTALADETWLQTELDEALETHGLTALGAAFATLNTDPVIAVSGEAAKGSGEPATPDDAWHIGSNSKALTALLYARLVEEGRATWGATLPELFPQMAGEMDPAWQDITIEDLLSHRSGIGQLGAIWLIARHNDKASLPEQRLETVRSRLRKPPEGEPGRFEYSNVNYIVAGAAIEGLLGMSWEDAMEAYVFNADGSDWSDGWGSGAPQSGLQGHKRGMFGGLKPAGRGPSADNPQALGPAGTLHVPLESHAQLLLEFVDEDSRFITPGMREHLLAPWPDESADYAMGWAVREDEALGRIYLHNGSNTMWLSRVALIPSLDAVIIVNASEFNDSSKDATQTLLDAVTDRLAASAD